MKILFLINGLGLGNSTRCHGIIQHLHSKGAEIQVVTSGNGLWYFADKIEITVMHEIEPLAYGSKDGEISILRTIGSITAMYGILKRNKNKLSNILDTFCPDAVVIDSDYNFLPVKRRNIPLVALNNADIVWHSYFRFKDRPTSIRAQFFTVEMLDFVFHKFIPDLVISPCLDNNVQQNNKNTLRVGPIVRKEYEATTKTTSSGSAVVMLSGSVFGTPVKFDRKSYPFKIDIIGREEPEEWGGSKVVTFHGKIKNTEPLLRGTDLVVVNGGFSAVSEMFWMKKPLVVVPVPRHAEQWINAKTIEYLGLGLIATQENYEDIMLKAAARIEEFRLGFEKLGPLEDGAKQASQAILQLAIR